MAMMREILSGLAFMHSKNFVHRDLKPTNILLQDNHIKIGDFGLVKEISDDDESSMAGNSSSGDTRMLYAVGTFPYAAPELSAGTLNPTTKSDIYSLGVTFLEMCMCVTTRHELHVNLTKLKEDQLLPPKTWYKQAQIIKTMVSGLPERRPSAEYLLSSPLFTSDQISNVNVMAQSTALRYQPPYQADFFLTLPLRQVKVVCDQGAVKLPYTPSSSSIDSDAAMKNPVSGLYQLAERLSLKPEYNFRSSGTSSNVLVFECTVTVGEHSFTSPPNCRRKQDAKVAAAKIAFVQLKKLFLEKRKISNQQASAVSLAPRDESLHSLYRRFRFPGINPLYSRPPLVASCAGFTEKNRQANVASLAPHDESSDRGQDGKRLSDSFENMSLNESHGCSFSRNSSFDGAVNVGPTGGKDPVSAFMEYGQSKRLSADIVVLRQSGPPNSPVFEMAATLGERQFPAITCHNKKQGRKLAAKAALEIVEKENRVQA